MSGNPLPLCDAVMGDPDRPERVTVSFVRPLTNEERVALWRLLVEITHKRPLKP